MVSAQRHAAQMVGVPPLVKRPLLQASVLALVIAQSVANVEMKDEWGQEVLGCRCAGRKRTHGYCGYHFQWGAQEDKPWCRTEHGCGNSSVLGSWIHCDDRGVERRRAEDGKLYTAREFKEYYGDKGEDKWIAAEAHIEKRMAKNGQPYTVFQFRDYYVDAVGEQGWITEWISARPERRRAEDGAWYTWEEFVTLYGDLKARSKWALAQLSGKSEL